MQCVSLCVLCNLTALHIKSLHKTALTGHPRHSLSRCQASPSLHLLSPSLEAAHQKRGEAGAEDLSLQWEVPLQAPVTAMPPPDTLRKNKKEMHTCSGQSKLFMVFKTALKSKENYMKLVITHFLQPLGQTVNVFSTCLQTGYLGVVDWVLALSWQRRSIRLGGCQERDQ